MENRVVIRAAETAADFASVRALCQEFLDWLRERYAASPWIVETYYPDTVWQQLLDDLPVIHASPGGGVWIAVRDGVTVGTIMLKGLPSTGDCEMKRLVVGGGARGLGLGRALVDRLVVEALDRGYRRLLFDTGIDHREAIGLYRSMGFVERDAYYEVPADLASMLVFFEGELEALGGGR